VLRLPLLRFFGVANYSTDCAALLDNAELDFYLLKATFPQINAKNANILCVPVAHNINYKLAFKICGKSLFNF